MLELNETTRIKVGSLGEISFPAGYYAYVGSAKRNLDSRVMRHLRLSKKKRWHVDYLREKAEIIRIYLSNLEECTIYKSLVLVPGYQVVAPGFGSSDCRSCESHLAYFQKAPDLSILGI
ncbi:MAG: GIY-YIG nuclease family protein [Candidatus Hydrothermarchaeales archaeon]